MDLIKADVVMTTQILNYQLDEDTESILEGSDMFAIEEQIKTSLGEVYPFVSLVVSESKFFNFHLRVCDSMTLSRRHLVEAFTWLQIHISKEHPELTLLSEEDHE